MSKKQIYHPWAVPEELFVKLEKKAMTRRKNTGENIGWTSIIKEILEEHFDLVDKHKTN